LGAICPLVVATGCFPGKNPTWPEASPHRFLGIKQHILMSAELITGSIFRLVWTSANIPFQSSLWRLCRRAAAAINNDLQRGVDRWTFRVVSTIQLRFLSVPIRGTVQSPLQQSYAAHLTDVETSVVAALDGVRRSARWPQPDRMLRWTLGHTV